MKSKDKNAIKSAWSAAIAFTTFSLVLNALPSAASAKKPGATYCFNGVCHRVKTIEEVQAQIGLVQTVGASLYHYSQSPPENPSTTLSSGEELVSDETETT